MNFDHLDDVDADVGFTLIPDGETVEVTIVETEEGPLGSGKGRYARLVLEVASGEYQGKKIFERLNYVHESPKTQEIAAKRLKAYKLATIGNGVSFSDLDQIAHQSFYVTVGIEPYTNAKGVTRDGNVIKRVHWEQGSTPPASKPAASAPAPRQAPPAATRREPPAAKPAAGGNKLPWKRDAA